MANDCLVTKLKGVVDNPNLPVFGAAELVINTESAKQMNFYDLSSIRFKEGVGSITVEGTTISTGEYTIQNPSDVIVTFNAGSYKVYLFSKYNISYINQGGMVPEIGINLSDCSYIPSIQMTSQLCFGTFKAKVPVTGFNLWRVEAESPKGNCYVDLDSFVGSTNLPTFRAQNITSFAGSSIEGLSDSVQLIAVSTPGSPGGTGDIATMCANQVAKGRTSGQIDFDVVGSGFSYNGRLIMGTEDVAFITGGGNAWRFIVEFSPSYEGGFKAISVL